MNSNKKYVVLEGIEHGNRFYTTNVPGEDPTKSAKGENWYKVLGYADTSEEAQAILYPNPGDQQRAMEAYIRKSLMKMSGLLPMDA